MLSRLETMVLMGLELPLTAVRRQLASGIDIMVHLGRMRDKSRKVLEIMEITGFDGNTQEIMLHPLFRFEEEEKHPSEVRGKLCRKGELICREKLERAGLG